MAWKLQYEMPGHPDVMQSDRVLGGEAQLEMYSFYIQQKIKRCENQISRAVHSFGFLIAKKGKWNEFTLLYVYFIYSSQCPLFQVMNAVNRQ